MDEAIIVARDAKMRVAGAPFGMGRRRFMLLRIGHLPQPFSVGWLRARFEQVVACAFRTLARHQADRRGG
ncbi:hypothetical protein DC31_03115 [Microbacterium sp. CH12i]|nr:hypothetical protein DC31_03115 [Microbacterium sp. CH12i]